MKKSYFMMAAAATMFAACSQSDVINEVQVQEEAQTIGFSTYAGKVTRAENSPQGEKMSLNKHQTSFKVWSAKQLANDSWVPVYETGDVVTWNNDMWKVANTKYWDKSAKMYMFYAAAPSSANWGYDVNNSANDYSDDFFTLSGVTLAGTNLSTSDNVKYQESWLNANGDVDYLIATDKKVDRDFYTASTINKVNLEFNHILSRLNVTVKKDGSLNAATVVVTNLEVRNLLKAGNFNEGATLLHDETLATGTTGRWSTTGETYTINGVTYTMSTSPAYLLQALVIPQVAKYQPIDRNGTTPTTNPYIYIAYTINGEPYTATYNLAHMFVGENTNLKFFEGWQNTLNITIDADAIEFSAEVFKWADHIVNSTTIK